MADKFIDIVNGAKTQKSPITSSSGASDAAKIIATDAGGKIDSSLMPVGIGSETDTIPASENLAAGDMVNIWTDTGAVKVRKADATTAGKEANGFVLAAVTSGNNATVYRPSQSNNQLTGLTPGTMYYLGTSAGGVVSTPPSSSGNVVQSVGRAVSATALSFMPGEPVTLA